MKKLLAVLLILALCAGLAACGHFVPIMPGTDPVVPGEETGDLPVREEDGFQERGLYQFLGWETFGSRYYDDTPVALSIRIDGGYASPVFDRASIISACDALRSMTVTDRAEEPAADARQTVFTFTMSSGDEYAVTFSGSDLSVYGGSYTVTGGEALWNIVFPGYDSSFDMFDLYFDSGIRAFADGFGENTPVSVGRRYNGGATLTSQSPEVVEQVFRLFENASINRVEERPDQNIDLTQTTDYVFSMSDASYYTFTFTGPCLTVTASNAYGPVYYWLNGVDELPNLTILPQITIPTFEGGMLTGLRDDVARARAAATGESEITVIGVYVDYYINGDHGYLTLSGDTAVNFVRQVTAITAGTETTDAAGEAITVFITLSDQSGPILVFSGDTVQQMVGINYPCDGGAMASLRATILDLAQYEYNVNGAIEESTG